MTPTQLRDQIAVLAGQIKARSTSPTVDGWADEVAALALLIPSLKPSITERRVGERRSVDRFDDPVSGDRRTIRRVP